MAAVDYSAFGKKPLSAFFFPLGGAGVGLVLDFRRGAPRPSTARFTVVYHVLCLALKH
ncbi:MAG: hypothetical protein ACRD1X_21880 [Vicinamibacteria bacterium]